jgi:hypothetical protein
MLTYFYLLVYTYQQEGLLGLCQVFPVVNVYTLMLYPLVQSSRPLSR